MSLLLVSGLALAASLLPAQPTADRVVRCCAPSGTAQFVNLEATIRYEINYTNCLPTSCGASAIGAAWSQSDYCTGGGGYCAGGYMPFWETDQFSNVSNLTDAAIVGGCLASGGSVIAPWCNAWHAFNLTWSEGYWSHSYTVVPCIERNDTGYNPDTEEAGSSYLRGHEVAWGVGGFNVRPVIGVTNHSLPSTAVLTLIGDFQWDKQQIGAVTDSPCVAFLPPDCPPDTGLLQSSGFVEVALISDDGTPLAAIQELVQGVVVWNCPGVYTLGLFSDSQFADSDPGNGVAASVTDFPLLSSDLLSVSNPGILANAVQRPGTSSDLNGDNVINQGDRLFVVSRLGLDIGEFVNGSIIRYHLNADVEPDGDIALDDYLVLAQDIQPNITCLADLTGVGGLPEMPDGQITVDDLIEFINSATNSTLVGDVCGVGGLPSPPDGEVAIDDLIEFTNSYSNGC